jgi:purine-binding chemotaxis protein CheW
MADRFMSVQVGGAAWGLPLGEVQEVISLRPLTRVFHAPDPVAGVTSLRGEMLPVIDLGIILGLGSTASASARIVVVAEAGGLKRRAGLRVDEIGGLRDAPDEGLSPLPPTISSAARDLAVGVIPETPPCSVLSVARIFDSPLIADRSGRAAQGA